MNEQNKNAVNSGKNRCYGCMETMAEGVTVCPLCGYNSETENTSHRCLKPGTELPGGYIVGKPLSKGTFGITYLAYDVKNNRKAVVKEYMPNSLSARGEDGATVEYFDEQSRNEFEKGADKLLADADRVASLKGSTPVITDVYGSFKANGTAYVVNEYVQGKTLMSYISDNGGRLSPDESVRIITPVINALEIMHKKNIIHRDVAPDSIILTDNGTVKLLDFGSARMAYDDSEKCLTQLVKPGYSAREMYSSSKQGPWTDVYAVCATLYTAITGEVPAESVAGGGEAVASFASLGIQGCSRLEAVIKEGLEPNAEKRVFSTMQLKEMINDAVAADKKSYSAVASAGASGVAPGGGVYRANSSAQGQPQNNAARPAPAVNSAATPPPQQEKKKGKAGKVVVIILIVLFALFLALILGIVGILWWLGIIPFGGNEPVDVPTTQVTTDASDFTDTPDSGGEIIADDETTDESTTSTTVPEINQVQVPEADPNTTKKETTAFTFPAITSPPTTYYDSPTTYYDDYYYYDDTLYVGDNTFDYGSSDYKAFYFTPSTSGWYVFESVDTDGDDYMAALMDSEGNTLYANDDYDSNTLNFCVTGYCYANETVTLGVVPYSDYSEDIDIRVYSVREINAKALMVYTEFNQYGYYMTPDDETYADSPSYSSDSMSWSNSSMFYPVDYTLDGNTLWLKFAATNSDRGDHYVWHPIVMNSNYLNAVEDYFYYTYESDGYYISNSETMYLYSPDYSQSRATWNESGTKTPQTFKVVDDTVWYAFSMDFEDEGEIWAWYPADSF